MPFDILTFVLDKVIAANKGVSDQRATQLGIVGAVLPLGLLPSVLITQAIAEREAGTSTPPSTSPGTPLGTPPPSRQVQVPNVTKQSFTAAQNLLQSYSLQVNRQDVISGTTPKDEVIDQNPAAGTTVAIGATVTLSVSLGVVVPDVTNQAIADATAQLQAIGLQVQTVDQRSSTVQKGLVISQNPPAGSTVSSGSIVALTVSLGDQVIVPRVIEESVDAASKQLQDSGLQVKLTYQSSGAINKGFVIKQYPAAGTSP